MEKEINNNSKNCKSGESGLSANIGNRDNCPDCRALTGKGKVHPPLTYTKGPRMYWDIDVVKNRNKFVHTPGSGCALEKYREYMVKQAEKLPYDAITTDTNPCVEVQSYDGDYEDEEKEMVFKTTEVCRGGPNLTMRGGGPKAFLHGRADYSGVTEDTRTSIAFSVRPQPQHLRRVYAEQKYGKDF